MSTPGHLREMSYSELLQYARDMEGADRKLQLEITKVRCNLTAMEHEAERSYSVILEAVNQLDFPCSKRSVRNKLKYVRKLLDARLSQIEPGWDIPF